MKTPTPGNAKPHILVVDDEEPIRELLARFLERQGFEVATAGNGGQARALASQGHYALAVVDVNLADGESGLDVMDCLKGGCAGLLAGHRAQPP